jgi:hypothetical protein
MTDEIDLIPTWEGRLHSAYLNERLPYSLSLWRELICGHSIDVISPYLDLDVLEFVLGLPMELNDEDSGMLHSKAIWAAFPELGRVELSHGGWNAPDWVDEVKSHAPALRAMIVDEPSPLDSLVPPDVVLALLATVVDTRSSFTSASRGFRWRVRKWVKDSEPVRDALRRVRRNTKLWKGGPKVAPVNMLRSVLTLRLALAEFRDLTPPPPAAWEVL